MGRFTGTTARGLIAPIVRKGDDIVAIAVNTLLAAAEGEGFTIKDKDVLAITESIVARAQGNYATTEQIAADTKKKFGDSPLALVFPILSRNRFSLCLEGIAKAGNKLTVMLSFPADEVGNHLMDPEIFNTVDINPRQDSFIAEEFKKRFGQYKHPFTGIDYIEFFLSILHAYNKNSSVLISNNLKAIVQHAETVIACDIHTREKTKRFLQSYGVKKVYDLTALLNESVQGSGYNTKYGLLGSNKASDNSVKLFPNDCTEIVNAIQKQIKEKTGKTIEVMVYGDGAFKDPVGKIWELADPIVSPGFTSGLEGTPHELKLKYLADNTFADKSHEEQEKAIAEYIHKNKTQVADDAAERQGTTPRRLTDLIGSLSDLTSGSGDKGTPIVYIQGYFDKFGE
ncbi:F420-0--gamma-glutamyl ligase [Treponema phagedenis]|uniref:F420-0--gamma-glutamyl ligase n=1 Tax=Treponema phagedenis TaxID=162 RepID=A0A0B7GWU1_TREPH|nr:coenzyme F420-0:L-glutamate ligase [Treponema phagedenis]QEJ97265.1 F420-0--gamma-glutamyl ligase [Treponema phagedenis]QEK01795.1 F420-0--gamma-glutamyl ligase [Treponema phagedenis]QEK02542.1 F420-0--gamma-glutamyl ligase [Treponema phagedenis]QEK06908.1 F420-0--gamma-glutamyl ligase [Treponema phagedenis]QEK08170.1 F420-0--gamma-glutamyl ligase [Treponema phagedenis]